MYIPTSQNISETRTPNRDKILDFMNSLCCEATLMIFDKKPCLRVTDKYGAGKITTYIFNNGGK
jgi:hypothetical protein